MNDNKELIALLEKARTKNSFSRSIEYINQALAILKQEPCQAEVRHPIGSDCKINHKRNYCYSCGMTVKNQKYCHGCGKKLKWPACCDEPESQAPDREKPVSEFVEECREFIRLRQHLRDKVPMDDMVLEACDRLTTANKRAEDAEKWNKTYLENLDKSDEEIRQLQAKLKRAERDLRESFNAKVRLGKSLKTAEGEIEKLREYTVHLDSCTWHKWQTLNKPSCNCGLAQAPGKGGGE